MNAGRMPGAAIVIASIQTLLSGAVLVNWAAWATWGVFPNSLLLSGAVFLPVLAVSVVSAFGLWRGRFYGWATCLIANGIFLIILLATIHPVWLSVIPAIFIASLFSDSIRRYYFER